MGKIIREAETRVNRTYRGGMLLDEFLGKANCEDSFYPEDWISSFVEAKNKNYVPNEGLSKTDDGTLITDKVAAGDYGEGRTDAGVLIKLLDSCERLGIQVHPTDDYAMKIFGTPYGKTECWHILNTRTIDGIKPKIYIGFKPYVTKELWEKFFIEQNIAGMLDAMIQVEVNPGDTILVRGGMPHAIGGGCFMLEIQQPSDYTMRCETTPLSGDPYTPMQIHYGAGEAAMLACFDYTPRDEDETRASILLRPRTTAFETYVRTDYVGYEDTPHFALSEIDGSISDMCEDSCLTLISLENRGCLRTEGKEFSLKRGDRFFAAANTHIDFDDCKMLLCYPPKRM